MPVRNTDELLEADIMNKEQNALSGLMKSADTGA